MIKVKERFPNFVDPGDDHKYWSGEFETLFEVFECELVKRWKDKLGKSFRRICINHYPDPSGIYIEGSGMMLTLYDKENTAYNIANIR